MFKYQALNDLKFNFLMLKNNSYKITINFCYKFLKCIGNRECILVIGCTTTHFRSALDVFEGYSVTFHVLFRLFHY